jgi:hypothetical protein
VGRPPAAVPALFATAEGLASPMLVRSLPGSWRPGAKLILACAAAGLLSCSPAGRPHRVVLAVIDTLRADHRGCYGYGSPSPTARSPDSATVEAMEALRAEAQVEAPGAQTPLAGGEGAKKTTSAGLGRSREQDVGR